MAFHSRAPALMAGLLLGLAGPIAGWLPASLATPLAAQTVSGTVVDPEEGDPLSDVRLRLLDSGDREAAAVFSDDSGRFLLTAPRAGWWRIAAELLGYGSVRSEPLDLRAGDTLTVEVRMALEPLQIQEPVVVRGKPSIMSLDITEFERRRRWGERSGLGHFIYGEEIDRGRPGRPTDLLRRVPGVTVSGTSGYGQVVQMRGGCVPAIFIDGGQINSGGQSGRFGGMTSLDTYVDVASIEGIEVYRGAHQPGGRFVDRSGCGLVLVWTRRGEYDPEARFSWLRLLVGLGLAASLLLLR